MVVSVVSLFEPYLVIIKVYGLNSDCDGIGAATGDFSVGRHLQLSTFKYSYCQLH